MKNKILIIAGMILISLSPISCKTTPTVSDGRNPQMNNNSFTNYTPWWATSKAPLAAPKPTKKESKGILIPAPNTTYIVTNNVLVPVVN